MNREICCTVNYIAESIRLLQKLTSATSYNDLKTKLMKKHHISLQTKEHVFQILTRIENDAKKIFDSDMEVINYYFHSLEDVPGCCGNTLLLYSDFSNAAFEDLDQFFSKINSYSLEEYCIKFGHSLQSYLDSLQNDDTFIDYKDPLTIISFLMSMDISIEEKWKLQTVFLQKEEHLEKIYQLLKKAIAFLHKYDKELTALSEEFYTYWSNVLSEQSFLHYLNQYVSIDLPENPYGFRVCASIFEPCMLATHIDTDDDGHYKCQDEGTIGILFGDEFLISLRTGDDEQTLLSHTQAVLKHLSDKSKFEILMYISKNKRAYGSELAKHLNLTTATISHHMTSMMTEGLVSIEKIDNRVYYSLNKDALSRALDFCQHIFINE